MFTFMIEKLIKEWKDIDQHFSAVDLVRLKRGLEWSQIGKPQFGHGATKSREVP
jgi:hypothetical protein